MKTKNLLTGIMGAFLFFVLASSSGYAQTNELERPDTTTYIDIMGKVVDRETEEPVIFTNVYMVGSNLGTVSNSEGEFIIKVPKSAKDKKIGFSNIGYNNLQMDVASLKKSGNIIMLEPAAIPIEEVEIRSDDPEDLLRAAMKRIPENYNTVAEKMTAFYRETIKQNWNYVAVSEAVVEVYKAPYNRTENDQVKIFKGRKSEDVKKMDTLIFKLQGGPNTMVLLDVVKNPNILLDPEMFEFYEYELVGVLNIDDKQNYVIKFDQKKTVDYALYSGKIYLDVNNLAVTGLEFNLSERGIDKATNVLVRKKPLTLKVEPLGAYYLVNYRQEDDGKWYLNHVRSELVLKCKWKRKLFSSKYTAMAEMAVTDKTKDDVERFRNREVLKRNEIFIEGVSEYYDEDFWGGFNYIKPEESIEDAIEKINRRMLRRLSSID
ncbi:MAG: carboxypeptidase-like regulatory domain-containing protein [Bacteroidota bacterium]